MTPTDFSRKHDQTIRPTRNGDQSPLGHDLRIVCLHNSECRPKLHRTVELKITFPSSYIRTTPPTMHDVFEQAHPIVSSILLGLLIVAVLAFTLLVVSRSLALGGPMDPY